MNTRVSANGNWCWRWMISSPACAYTASSSCLACSATRHCARKWWRASARRCNANACPAAWAWDAGALDHWGNEVELFHQGDLLRLDRLVRRRGEGGAAGTWWVLDFKSHEHPERQPEYLAQMQRYRQAMALARPGEPVRLAFINPLGQLIPLSPEQLAS